MSIEFVTQKKKSYFENRIKNQLEFNSQDLTPPFPKTALVEIANWCNHSCVFCTYPRMIRQKNFLNLDLYRSFLKQGISLGLEEVGLYTTGEPFFVKNLDQFIKIAKELGTKYVYLTT